MDMHSVAFTGITVHFDLHSGTVIHDVLESLQVQQEIQSSVWLQSLHSVSNNDGSVLELCG